MWNELKGFWNARLNRWDYEAYTAFYNTVYDALKAYDPTLHVLFGDADLGLKKYDEAVEEYQTALELKPKKPNEIKLKLARTQKAQGKDDEAKATLDGVLKDDPEMPAAAASTPILAHETKRRSFVTILRSG